MKPGRITASTVVTLPVDPAERRARRLDALWEEEDRAEQRLREIRARIAPLQCEVARDRGFLVKATREQLQRPEPTKRKS